MGKLLAQQERYWKQRSKQFCLHEGDSNTHCFHQSASVKRKKNSTSRLRDSSGQWRKWNLGLEKVIFFADDSFPFFRANLQESSMISKYLKLYEKASGQMVNFHKSSISFSSSTDLENWHVICDFFGVQETRNQGKYLGLPSLIGNNKSQIFSFIKDKAWGRIRGWKRLMLLRAGKKILLKTIVQTIPFML